jgi:hypothetical protein
LQALTCGGAQWDQAHHNRFDFFDGASVLTEGPAGRKKPPHSRVPFPNTGTGRPSARMPPMSVLSERIIQSIWMRLLLPPCEAIEAMGSLAVAPGPERVRIGAGQGLVGGVVILIIFYGTKALANMVPLTTIGHRPHGSAEDGVHFFVRCFD